MSGPALSAPSVSESPIVPLPDDGYRAGACNIGPREIRRRRLFGIVGFGGAVALLALLVAVGAPAWTRLLVLLPAWGGAVSWLQARRRFCVAFGMAGIANFTDDDAGRVRIVDAEQREADRRAAAVIVRDGLLLVLVPVLVLVLLPI